MARGGYRQQGSEQEVRVIHRSGLGGPGTLILVLVGLALSGLLVRLGVAFKSLEAILFAMPLTMAVVILLEGTIRQVHEIAIGPAQVRVRVRHFPGFWTTRPLARPSVTGVERSPGQGPGSVRLALRTREGGKVPLLGGHEVHHETAENLTQVLERALDPDQIDELADEHRAVTLAEK